MFKPDHIGIVSNQIRKAVWKSHPSFGYIYLYISIYWIWNKLSTLLLHIEYYSTVKCLGKILNLLTHGKTFKCLRSKLTNAQDRWFGFQNFSQNRQMKMFNFALTNFHCKSLSYDSENKFIVIVKDSVFVCVFHSKENFMFSNAYVGLLNNGTYFSDTRKPF